MPRKKNESNSEGQKDYASRIDAEEALDLFTLLFGKEEEKKKEKEEQQNSDIEFFSMLYKIFEEAQAAGFSEAQAMNIINGMMGMVIKMAFKDAKDNK